MWCLALVLLIGQPAPADSSQSSPQARRQDHFDDLWKVRDQPGKEKELEQLLAQALARDPGSFEANARLSALKNWIADAAEGDEKAALGRTAWEAADKAIAARPDDVRGHYNAAVGIGLYSEGVGIISALSQGLEGKFRERILTEAVRSNPTNLRAKLYLADCFADADKVDEGTKLVQQILAAPAGADPPEERRLKTKARNWLEAHGPPNTAQ